MSTSTSDFEKLQSRFERPARIVSEFKRLNADSPALARELLAELAGVLGVKSPAATNGVRPHQRRETNYDKVARVLAAGDNGWQVKKWIASAAGMSIDGVSQIIHKGNPESFESQRHQGGHGRQMAYRLTAAAYEQAKKEVSNAAA